MAHKIQIKRGNKADLPTLDDGEFGLCQDTNELFIGNDGNQKIFPPTAPTISDIEGLQTALDGKVDNSRVLTDVPANAKFTDTVTTINGKTGVITKADITALGIPAQDTVYTHPATHSADMIVDGTTNKAYTATEKDKLAGIEPGANKTTIAVHTATLTTTWEGTSAPYTQDITVVGITSSDVPIISPVYSTDNATAILQKEAWNLIGKAVTNTDTITFTCFEEKPVTAILIQIKVVR
jgi:hypothetical protein